MFKSPGTAASLYAMVPRVVTAIGLMILCAQGAQSARADVGDAYVDLARQFTDRLDAVGIVGTVYEDGAFYDFTSGVKDLVTRTPMDEDTFIELGSATKTFTGTLLSLEIVRGRLRLDQVVSTFFPELDGTPAGAITIAELATHTSGLPRMPDNLLSDNGDVEPMRNYTVADLLTYLRTAELDEKSYEYSNTGVALLSQILSVVSGLSYADMIREFIVQPLSLDGLVTEWSPELEHRLAGKYSSILQPEPYWTDLNAMNGTGVIKITLRSIKKFLEAQLYPERLAWPLREAILLSHQIAAETETFKMGLGWFEDTINGVAYLNHNGSTEGFTVEMLFDPEGKRAFFYASNTDLMFPGICLTELFTGGACTVQPHAPIVDKERFKGRYLVGEGEDTYEFEIAEDEVYGFLYVVVDRDMHQRLFFVDESTLASDMSIFLIQFTDADHGMFTDNWEEPEVGAFERVPGDTNTSATSATPDASASYACRRCEPSRGWRPHF